MATKSSDDQPRKSLIIKLSLSKRKAPPPPLNSDDSDRDKKRMKIDDSTTTLVNNNVVDVKNIAKRVFAAKESAKLIDDDFKKKIIKERNDEKDQKREKVAVVTDEKDSRSTRTPSSPFVKEEKKKKKKMMEQRKKNQCWVIVKRMIVGKDGWALKKALDLKVLYNYEEIKEEFKVTTMKTIGLEDIEIKLNKFLYSRPEEFADDMRLVFSRALLFPPRSQIHKIAKRFSDSFEISWKSLKKQWRLEEIERKRVHKGSK